MGDPLILKNLKDYLDLISKYNLKVFFVTAGHLVDKSNYSLLTHAAIKQVNFSINSFDANVQKSSLENYLDNLLDFALFANGKIFINFRLWNLTDDSKSDGFNSRVIDIISARFNITKENSYIQVAPKTRIVFDKLFEWPSINKPQIRTMGSCHGIINQLGILNNGTVVPCCLDFEGVINLGNIFKSSLKEILNTPRSHEIRNGFKSNKLTEKLCQSCGFATRFDLYQSPKDPTD